VDIIDTLGCEVIYSMAMYFLLRIASNRDTDNNDLLDLVSVCIKIGKFLFQKYRYLLYCKQLDEIYILPSYKDTRTQGENKPSLSN
jgi:hypothetical protein